MFIIKKNQFLLGKVNNNNMINKNGWKQII